MQRLPGGRRAKKPTVAAELDRLVAAGTVAPEVAGAYRATYDDAKTRRKKLTGARYLELGGVIRDLDDMAARDQFTPSRLPALFLTLQRNVQFWTTAPLPAPGYRTSFTGSELVYQFYPGHGIQIQWLGTFGKLNGYWSGGARYDTRAGALLDEIKALAAERAGGLAWEYLFPFDGQRPPWVSSLAQGTGLQAMARSATRLNRQADIFPTALAGLKIFQTRPPAGVRVSQADGAHYLQYSGLPRLKILNGFIQSLVGLYDFANLTGDPTAQSLFEDGDRAARAEVPTFDTGAWSLYSRGSTTRESDLGYHKLLRDFLVSLCTRTKAQPSTARRAALHRLPDDAAGARVRPDDAAGDQDRQAEVQALEGRAGRADDQARRQRGRHARPGRARLRDQDDLLEGAEEDRRLHRRR